MGEVRNQIIVFFCTFMVYAGLHTLRSSWSYNKSFIQQKNTCDFSQIFLGSIDLIYLFNYSLAVVFLGFLGDRINPKILIFIGVTLAATVFSVFPLVNLIQNSCSKALLIIMMGLNGIFQFPGWPVSMAILGPWFQSGRRGLILGIWGGCANIGNIIGYNISQAMNQHFVWNYSIFVASGQTIIYGLCLLILVKLKKEQKQVPQIGVQQKQNYIHLQNQQQIEQQPVEQQQTRINFFTAWCIPGVALYAIGYATLKGSVYGLLFWLPNYLNNNHLDGIQGSIATMIDVGQFLGGLIVGQLGDYFKLRSLFLSPSLILCALLLIISKIVLHQAIWPYYVLMFLIGLTIGGPYIVISTAIAIDIGQEQKLLGNKKAISTISSVMQGTGGIFSAVSMVFIPYIGLDFIFYLFSIYTAISSIVLFPLFLKDLRKLRNKVFQNKNDQKSEQ